MGTLGGVGKETKAYEKLLRGIYSGLSYVRSDEGALHRGGRERTWKQTYLSHLYVSYAIDRPTNRAGSPRTNDRRNKIKSQSKCKAS